MITLYFTLQTSIGTFPISKEIHLKLLNIFFLFRM